MDCCSKNRREEHAESKGPARDAPPGGLNPAGNEGDKRSRLQNASPLTSVESPDFKMKIDSPSARPKYGFAEGLAFARR